MSKYRQAARVDDSQTKIVKDLRKLGYSVIPGHDDILVGNQGNTYWYECKSLDVISKKTGQPRASAIKLSQRALLRDYKGHYKIVWTTQMIIDDIKSKMGYK